jgi:3-methyladenine DNA glycosylase/8-oxoguanine DNA glycosylase
MCSATRMLAAGRSPGDVTASLDLSQQSLDRLFRGYLGTSPNRLKAFLDQALGAGDPGSPEGRPPVLEAEVPYEPPLDLSASMAILGDRAADGVELVDDRSYRRLFPQAAGAGAIAISGSTSHHLVVAVTMQDWSGYAHVMQRARNVINLDADGHGAARLLSRDAVIGQLVRDRPGVRPPGCWDPFEAATKAILGCGWDVRGRQWLRRLAETTGRLVEAGYTPGLTRLFPTPADVVQQRVNDLGLPFVKAVALHGMARSICQGSGIVDPCWPIHERVQELASLTGVGPVTGARYAWILGDADAYPEKAGAPLPGVDAGHRKRARHVADQWRPYRSFAYAQLAVSASPRPHQAPTETDGGLRIARHRSEELRQPQWSAC